MRYIRTIIPILILTAISGCTSVPIEVDETPLQVSSNAITCVHKYESSWQFTYEPENITRFISNNVIQFYIKDVQGRDIFLNIYEIENYNCR
jgi:hypothetical protein